MTKSKSNKRIVRVDNSSLAMFEGSFGAILGLGVAILHSLRTTVDVAQETQSVLSGAAFGLATGIVSILLLPFIYFGLGWLIGYFHAFVFNVVAETAGGIALTMNDE